MKRGDKKGLSTIIATLLIILLVLVAAGIIWVVVKKVISKNSELVAFESTTVDLEIISVTQPKNPATGNIISTKVKVRRNPGEGEIVGLIFSITNKNGESYVFEKNESIKQLEVKLFELDYNGSIVSISVAPIFLTESGKKVIGNIGDTHYEPDYRGAGSGTGEDDDCTPDCIRGAAGYVLECGPSENNCGSCGTCSSPLLCDYGICCEIGHHNYQGTCQPDCDPSDCGTRQCGPAPAKPGCGENFCGTCNEQNGEVCNENTWTCDVCVPTCGPTQNCGLDPTCHSSCGECNEQNGEVCNTSNMCEVFVEPIENTGYVNSYWPRPDGRMLFDSDDLPKDKTVIDFYRHYVRFPENQNMKNECLMIYDFVTPINPNTYNMSYVKISENPTKIEDGDKYEIYQTIQGCCQGGYC